MATYQSELLNKHLNKVVKQCFSQASKTDIKNMLVEGRIGTMELLGLIKEKKTQKAA